MALYGIPISEDQCMGDSLPLMNAAFSALDVDLTRARADIGSLIDRLPLLATKLDLDPLITMSTSSSLLSTGQVATYNASTRTWVASSTRIDSSSLETNGWMTTPSGVEFRWGKYEFPANEKVTDIFFQKRFPGGSFVVLPTAPSTAQNVCMVSLNALYATISASSAATTNVSGFYVAIGF